MASYATFDLVSTSEAKTYCRVSNNDYDAELVELITRISSTLQGYCNRRLNKVSHIEYFSGDGESNKVFLRNMPVVDVQVWDDVNRDYGASSLIATSDYVIDDKNGIIELESAAFTKGLKNIKTSYTGGYSGTLMNSVNSNIKHMTLLWTARELKRHIEKLHGTETKSRGDVSETIEIGSMPKEVKEIADHYRMNPLF